MDVAAVRLDSISGLAYLSLVIVSDGFRRRSNIRFLYLFV